MSISKLSDEILISIGNLFVSPQLDASLTHMDRGESEIESNKLLVSLTLINRRFHSLFNPLLNLTIHDEYLGSILMTFSYQPWLSAQVKLLRLPGPIQSALVPQSRKALFPTHSIKDSASKCKKYLKNTLSFTLKSDTEQLLDMAKSKLLDTLTNLKVLVMSSSRLSNQNHSLTLGFAQLNGSKTRLFRGVLNCESITLKSEELANHIGTNLPIQNSLGLDLLSHLLLNPKLNSLEAFNVDASGSTLNLGQFQGLSKVKHLRLESVHNSTSLKTVVLLPTISQVSFFNHAIQLALGLTHSHSTLQTLTIPLGFFPLNSTLQEREALTTSGQLRGPTDYGFLGNFTSLKFLALIQIPSNFNRAENLRPYEILCHLPRPSSIFRINISKTRFTPQDLQLISLYFKLGWINTETRLSELQLFGQVDSNLLGHLSVLEIEMKKAGVKLFHMGHLVEFQEDGENGIENEKRKENEDEKETTGNELRKTGQDGNQDQERIPLPQENVKDNFETEGQRAIKDDQPQDQSPASPSFKLRPVKEFPISDSGSHFQVSVPQEGWKQRQSEGEGVKEDVEAEAAEDEIQG